MSLVFDSPDKNTSFTMLPNHVDGFIDLKVLADIHQALCMSVLEEDLELATWVKDHFLYEPTTGEGREIRTSEGFSKLDRAYRRVRLLTNKAQDKWPFYDRAWKKMSNATVMNNARGEAAPGVSLPGMTNGALDSPIRNEQSAHKDKASVVSPGFVPSGTKKPASKQPQPQLPHQSFSGPVPNTPISISSENLGQLEGHARFEDPLEAQEQREFVHEAQSNLTSTLDPATGSGHFAQSEGQTGAQTGSTPELRPETARKLLEEPNIRSMSAVDMSDTLQNSVSLQPATEDVEWNTDNPKVRGPNGRYMPKCKTSPSSANSSRTTGSKRPKFARKSKANRDTVSDTDEEDETDITPASANFHDEVIADEPPTPASAVHSKLHGHDGPNGDNVPAAESVIPAGNHTNDIDKTSNRSLSEPTSNHVSSHLSGMASSGSPRAYTLAAESDPVTSNLDRRPPNLFRKYKRKSEPVSQEGPKRKRGRPRLSEQQRPVADGEEEEKPHGKSSAALEEPAVVEAEEGEVSRVGTRRTTRRSTTVKPDLVIPAKTASTKPISKKKHNQVEDLDGEIMIDVDDEEKDMEQEALVASKLAPTSLVRLKLPSIIKMPSQPALSTSKKSSETTTDPPAHSLRKTRTPSKRSGKKTALQKRGGEMDSVSNGISHNPPKAEAKSTAGVLEELTSAQKSPVTNGLIPSTPIENPKGSICPGKVEYFARVHTSTGIVELSIKTDDLKEEVELIRKYADWMKAEGGTQIPYQTFKSIYGIAKRG